LTETLKRGFWSSREELLFTSPRKCTEELLERGVRLGSESGRPIAHVAADLGIHHEALRKRVRQAEADAGEAAPPVDLERA
jgi:transposase